MRIAKQLLHKAIVDIILNFEPNDEELDEGLIRGRRKKGINNSDDEFASFKL